MTTVLAFFIIPLVLSLVLTPPAGRLGISLGAVDEPEERKVHSRPVARCSGVGKLWLQKPVLTNYRIGHRFVESFLLTFSMYFLSIRNSCFVKASVWKINYRFSRSS